MSSMLTSDVNVDTVVNGFQTVGETPSRRGSVAEQRPGVYESEQRQGITGEFGFRIVQSSVKCKHEKKD
jgi:hypothetical protein